MQEQSSEVFNAFVASLPGTYSWDGDDFVVTVDANGATARVWFPDGTPAAEVPVLRVVLDGRKTGDVPAGFAPMPPRPPSP
jgi:hypothetical protein